MPEIAGALAGLRPTARWMLLVVVSLVLATALEKLKLPAALLLGPLAAAVIVQSAGASVTVPRAGNLMAQAVIGCLVARSITPAILAGFAHHWLLYIGIVLVSVSVSAGIGWAISRLGIIPGNTAVWGMIPGAASVMMVMAEAHGADAALVAFMQYLRVVLVALTASAVALLFAPAGGGYAATSLLSPVDWYGCAETLAVAVVGGGAAIRARVPAGVLLGPLVLGAVLGGGGLIRIELPQPVLIASYALIGWGVGLRFTGPVLAAALHALPQAIAAALLLISFCGLLAGGLVWMLHIDPLTAYLATSPGGVDAAAIIAASAKVDTPFIMALQVSRVLMLVIIGPRLARWVASAVA